MKHLTEKQKAFCRFYLEDFNATQAAIRAGYSKKSARQQATRLLTNVSIQNFLSDLQKPIFEKFQITQERILEEVAALAFSNIATFIRRDPKTGEAWIDITQCPEEDLRALSGFEVTELPPQRLVEDGEEVARTVLRTKIKMRDKWQALEALMKRYDLIKPDRIDVNMHRPVNDDDKLEVARRVAFMLREAAEIQKKRAIQKQAEDA